MVDEKIKRQNLNQSIEKTGKQQKRYVTDSEDKSQDCVPPNPLNIINNSLERS